MRGGPFLTDTERLLATLITVNFSGGTAIGNAAGVDQLLGYSENTICRMVWQCPEKLPPRVGSLATMASGGSSRVGEGEQHPPMAARSWW